MNTFSDSRVKTNQIILDFISIRGLIYTFLLITSAVLLPAAAHLTGAPVRILLPMHWPVILAGLVLGYRGGAVVGILSPVVSYLISGMPYAPMLLPMTIELCAYGLLTGLLFEKVRLNAFLAVTIALVAGRIAFIGLVGLFGSFGDGFIIYAKAALLPGLAAASLQVILLPVIARKWINEEKRGRSNE